NPVFPGLIPVHRRGLHLAHSRVAHPSFFHVGAGFRAYVCGSGTRYHLLFIAVAGEALCQLAMAVGIPAGGHGPDWFPDRQRQWWFEVKAAVFQQHGAPEVLEYTDVPDPQIGPRDVLVRVRACALNHLDLWVRGGLPNVPIPLPHIPGSDVAGEVAKIGAEVTTVRVGQKVVLAPAVTCGKWPACLGGLDSRCRQFSNLGYMSY